MSDGVQLSADLIMPEPGGKFPALLQYMPYRKDDMSIGENAWHYYFAERGYVGARVDIRGTGSSEGYCVDEYSLQETKDGQEVIRWLSQQDWCTGDVGMFGFSYSGQTTMMAAMNSPPALKAIVCGYFSDDRYSGDENYLGGSVLPWNNYATYGPFMNAWNFLPPYPEYCGSKWIEMWKERLEKSEPWAIQWLSHQLDDEYWRPGSVKYHYDGVRAPTFLMDGWRDGFQSAALRMYENLKSPKKIIVGPWLHTLGNDGTPGSKIDALHEMLRWWDYWLKGEENGITSEPPISIYVQKLDFPEALRETTSGFWRNEAEWPIKRTDLKILYFSKHNSLSTAPTVEEQ